MKHIKGADVVWGVGLALLMILGSGLDWAQLRCLKLFRPKKYRYIMERRQMINEFMGS
jgi:hypothetical protein